MGEERYSDEPPGVSGGSAVRGVSGGYRERASRLAGAVLWTRTAPPTDRPVLPDGRTAAVAAALARGCPVAEVARSVALSERQLHRLSLDAFGYGPKTLTRVLRFVRALGLARSGMPRAQVAARAGYADQAHLAREVKALAGAPMGALLAPG